MGDGSLTQDEIDALLQGADEFSGGGASEGGGEAPAADGGLSPSEKDVLAETLQDALTRSSGSISSFISKEVRFANAYADSEKGANLNDEYKKSYISFQSNLSGQLSGDSNLLIPLTDAVKIAATLLSQEEYAEGELDGAQEQALKEMMSPMITAYFVNISHKSGINFGSGPIKIVQLNGTDSLNLGLADDYVKVSFNMNISGLVDSKIVQVLPFDAAAKIAKSTMSGGGDGGAGGGAMAAAAAGKAPVQSSVNVDDVEFPELAATGASSNQANLNLLLDIKMDLTVELGRTRKYVKEILSLGEGSIIELDKLAGEPVDLLVNNKLIARGEVVVIDENFGVRVTDIVKPEDRLRSVKEGM